MRVRMRVRTTKPERIAKPISECDVDPKKFREVVPQACYQFLSVTSTHGSILCNSGAIMYIFQDIFTP
jgi:hypothetical protein